MNEEIPEEVAAAMVKAGAVDARYGNASLSALGRAAGVHTTTVSKLILRGERIAPEKLDALAEALGVTPARLMEWCTGQRIRPYSPPAVAETLDDRERKAVDEIIRLLAARKEQDLGDTDEKKTEPAPADAVGYDAGTEEKTPGGLSQADLRLAARKSGRKFDKK